MFVCLLGQNGSPGRPHPVVRRRAESLELRRSPTRTTGSPKRPVGCFRCTTPIKEGLGPVYRQPRAERWVGRSEGDDLRSVFHFTPPSHSRVAPHDWPKGGPVERSNLGWPGGGLGDLDAPRSTWFRNWPPRRRNQRLWSQQSGGNKRTPHTQKTLRSLAGRN